MLSSPWVDATMVELVVEPGLAKTLDVAHHRERARSWSLVIALMTLIENSTIRL
jgi:hypothetical protein